MEPFNKSFRKTLRMGERGEVCAKEKLRVRNEKWQDEKGEHEESKGQGERSRGVGEAMLIRLSVFPARLEKTER